MYRLNYACLGIKNAAIVPAISKADIIQKALKTAAAEDVPIDVWETKPERDGVSVKLIATVYPS